MNDTVREDFNFFGDFYVGATYISSMYPFKNACQTPTGESKKEVHIAGVSTGQFPIGVNEL